MKRVFILTNILLLLLLLFSCDKKNIDDPTLESEKNPVSNPTLIDENQELFNKYDSFASKLTETYNCYYNESNYCISPFSLYNSLRMYAYSITNRDKCDALTELNMVEDRKFRKIHNFISEDYIFESYHLSESEKYESESAGHFINKNSVWISSVLTVDQFCLNSLLGRFDVDVYYCDDIKTKCEDYIYNDMKYNYNFSLEDEMIYLNLFELSNIWNWYGKFDMTEELYSFINYNDEIKKVNFVKGSDYSKPVDFDTFSTFSISSREGYKMKFLVPKDGCNINDIFTKENIITVNNLDFTPKIGLNSEEKFTIDYTYCYFPEFTVDTSIDFKTGIFEHYDMSSLTAPKIILESDVNISFKQRNILDISHRGINAPVVSYGDVILYGTIIDNPNYEVTFHEFLVDRPFGFIITTKDNLQLYSGVIQCI